MVTRRTVLLGGLSFPVLVHAGIGERGVLGLMSEDMFPPASASRPFVSHTLFEAQVPETRMFAEVFAGTDATSVHALQGDIADFWYVTTRYGAERKRPRNLQSIAGMTLPTAAFCCEIVGRDLRMTMALRVDHRQEREGCIHHTICGPQTQVEVIAAALQDESHYWPQTMGAVIRGLGARDLMSDSVTRELVTAAPIGGPIGHLTTWVLAPVRRELPTVWR